MQTKSYKMALVLIGLFASAMATPIRDNDGVNNKVARFGDGSVVAEVVGEMDTNLILRDIIQQFDDIKASVDLITRDMTHQLDDIKPRTNLDPRRAVDCDCNTARDCAATCLLSHNKANCFPHCQQVSGCAAGEVKIMCTKGEATDHEDHLAEAGDSAAYGLMANRCKEDKYRDCTDGCGGISDTLGSGFCCLGCATAYHCL